MQSTIAFVTKELGLQPSWLKLTLVSGCQVNSMQIYCSICHLVCEYKPRNIKSYLRCLWMSAWDLLASTESDLPESKKRIRTFVLSMFICICGGCKSTVLPSLLIYWWLTIPVLIGNLWSDLGKAEALESCKRWDAPKPKSTGLGCS